jgi:hypothetical protein
MRIRIQIRIQGFDNKKLEKITAKTCFLINCYLLIPRPTSKQTSKLLEKFSSLKREHPNK